MARRFYMSKQYSLRGLILVILLILMGARSLLAEEFIPPMPENMEQTRISLYTVGLGNEIYTRYGHTMLRVEDPSHQLDYLVNWGVFEFEDPMFIPKFFRGILIYRMSFSPTSGTVRFYRDVEKRAVYSDHITLTSKQKQKLMERIIANAQPENLYYPYQYFRNNCATIPRNYLDETLNGQIKRAFGSVVVPRSYRDYVKSNLSNNPFYFWGIDVIFNSDTDSPLTKWEEMFYPLKLAEYLATLPSYNDDGSPNLNVPLLTNHRTVVEPTEIASDTISGYLLTWIIAGIPLLIIIGSILVNHYRKADHFRLWYLRAFGLVSIWWGFTHGFFGLTHFSGWALSNHTDLFHNFNMLLFWPIDMLVLVPGIQLGLLGKDLNYKSRISLKFWMKFSSLHIAILPIYAGVALSGVILQNSTRVVMYLAPLSLLYYLVFIYLLRWYQKLR